MYMMMIIIIFASLFLDYF